MGILMKLFGITEPKKIIEKEYIIKGEEARHVKKLCDDDINRASHYDLWNYLQTQFLNEDFSSKKSWMVENNDALTVKLIRYRIE